MSTSSKNDPEIPVEEDYEKIVQILKTCPRTYLGGLLTELSVRAADEFFKNDIAVITVISRALLAQRNAKESPADGKHRKLKNG